MKPTATIAIAAFTCAFALAGCGEDKSSSLPPPQPTPQAQSDGQAPKGSVGRAAECKGSARPDPGGSTFGALAGRRDN